MERVREVSALPVLVQAAREELDYFTAGRTERRLVVSLKVDSSQTLAHIAPPTPATLLLARRLSFRLTLSPARPP